VGIVAAALGAFGGGWLSDTEVTSADGGLVARYERFWRSGTPFDLDVRWRAAPEESTLWIDTAYLDHFVVDVVNPQPARVALDGARIYYTFLIAAEAAAAHATFRLKPRGSGVFRGEIGVLGASAVGVRQRIYP
jgi:hypothetical protein